MGLLGEFDEVRQGLCDLDRPIDGLQETHRRICDRRLAELEAAQESCRALYESLRRFGL